MMMNAFEPPEENFTRQAAALEHEIEQLKKELELSRKTEADLRAQLASLKEETAGCGQAEAELTRDREFLQKLFERIPIMITVYRPDLEMLQFNPAFEKTTGWTSEDANQGGDFMEKVYPRPEYRREVAEYMRSLQEGWRDFEVTAKDGSRIPSAWSNILLSDDTQIGIGIDLRERRREEQERNDSRVKLETTLESMTDAVFTSDAEGNFLEFNEAFATFHRFPNKAECAKTFAEYPEFLDVYFPDGTLAPVEMWAVPRALRGETVTNAEYHLHRRDTGDRWIGSYSFAPICDAEGRITGSVVVARDITEQKQAEQSLRESEQRYSSLFNAKTNGIAHCRVVTDEQGIPIDYEILKINDAYEQITGIKREDIEGRLATEVFPGIEHYSFDYIRNYGRVALHGGELNFEVFFEYLKQWLSIYIYSPKPGEFTAIFTDITERKLAEEALRASEAMVEAFFANSPGILNIEDDEFRYVKTDPITPTYFGLDRHSIVGKAVADLAPEFIEQFGPMMRRVIETGQPELNVEVYGPVSGRSGEVGSWLASYFPIPLQGGKTGVGIMGVEITEKKKAEQALRESEAKMRAVFQSLVEGVIFLDPSGEVEQANEAMASTYQHSLENLKDPLLSPRARIIHPDGSPFAVEEQPGMVALRTGEAVRDVEIGVLLPDGGISWRLINAQPVYGDQDNLLGAVVSLFDITERKHAEEALGESEERFSKAFRVSPDAMIISHLEDGKIIEVNESFERLFGYSRGEAIGKTTTELNIYADSDIRSKLVARIQAQGFAHDFEIDVRSHDGEVRFVSLSAEPMVVKGEQQLVTILHDLTERKRAEEALRASEERFRVALNNAPIQVYTTDLDLRYTWIYAPMNGFTPEEMVGKLDEDLLPAEDVHELVAFKRSVLVSRKGARTEIHLPFEGQIQTYNVTAEPLWDGDGRLVGLTVAAVDITGVLELKAEVVRREERIEIQRRINHGQEQERARIARDLHDGPLQELISTNFLVAEIQQIDDPEERAEKLQQLGYSLEEQAMELRSFCNELRPPALAPFGLEKAIRSHVEQIRERYPRIEVETRLAPDHRSIPEDLRMVLYRTYQEGMNNIIKHARASKVNVSFRFDEERAELELRDNGRGFVVPDSWITLAREGHLGLVGMRERVENTGGQILVNSAPGDGTTLRIMVPLLPPVS